MNILETKEVTKKFGGLTAVNQVSIHVEDGEIMGLIGPNGAGKTTLLNAIAGLDPPTSGSINFSGESTTGLPPEIMCHKGLSRTFQIPRPFPKMTVLENIMVASVFGTRNKKTTNPKYPLFVHWFYLNYSALFNNKQAALQQSIFSIYRVDSFCRD